MYAAPVNLPPGYTRSVDATDGDLMASGMEPEAVRKLERELSEQGLGLGFKFQPWKGVAKAAKFVATKAIPTVVKVGSQFLPGPAGAIARGAVSMFDKPKGAAQASGRQPIQQPFFMPFLPPQFAPPPATTPALAPPSPQFAPPSPQFVPVPGAPAPARAAAMPPWVIPLAIGAGVLAMTMGRR